MEHLVKACQKSEYPAKVLCVISDKENAPGLEKARLLGIVTHIFKRKEYKNKADYEKAILELLKTYNPDYLCLAGYMQILSATFVQNYENRILNIHPSLLPAFPGLHTHEEAIKRGVKLAGCTVHLVNAEIDAGHILAQAAVPVFETDTPTLLSRRILELEHKIYSAALAQFIYKNNNILQKKHKQPYQKNPILSVMAKL